MARTWVGRGDDGGCPVSTGTWCVGRSEFLRKRKRMWGSVVGMGEWGR
jgi:hypothetical protein